MKHFFTVLRFCITFCFLGIASFALAEDLKSFSVGALQVEILIDDVGEGDVSILQGVSPEMLDKYIPTGQYPLAVTSALVRDQERIMLIDTGLGYKMAQHLQERNIDPKDVEIILITHMHFDHINGLMHNGEAFFPNAKIYISEPEVAYWTDDANINEFPEDQREMIAGFFANSQAVLEAYGDRVITFSPGEVNLGGNVLLPNVQAIAAYGHTPGHTAFLLQSQGERLLLMGDLWHVGVIQFPDPDITVVYDVNPEQAAQSRRMLFAYAAANAIPVTGMHQSSPEFGLIKPNQEEKDGYIFEPLE